MKKLFLISIVSLFLFSCNDTKLEKSETLHEKAVIVNVLYSPSQHNTEITRTAYHDPMGQDFGGISYGVDYNGNSGIKVGKNMQITSTTIPEKYGVVFQCEHGTFSIDGSNPKYKILYDKLNRNVGDTVDVLYQEEYLLTFETKNDVRTQVSRVLNRLDFIDAQLIK